MLGGQQVCFYVFYIYFSIYVFMCFYDDTDIVLAILADVGKVGHLVAWFVGHDPLRRPQGAHGGLEGVPSQPQGGGLGGEVGPLREGNSSIAAKTAVERARADVVEACADEMEARAAKLTTWVSVLEDAWDRVDLLTQGMLS